MNFEIRTADLADIPRMHEIRLAVTENRLSDPTRVQPADYAPFVHEGSAWVCSSKGNLIGFSALDVERRMVWALFVSPEAQGTGAGSALLAATEAGAVSRNIAEISLVTEAGTVAERFYSRAGWARNGKTVDGELMFRRQLQCR